MSGRTRKCNRENTNVFSRSDHAAGERYRSSTAILCRSGRLHDRRRRFAERRIPRRAAHSVGLQLLDSDRQETHRTPPSVRFATSIWSSRTSKPRGAVCSNVRSPSARSGTRRRLEPGTEVSHPDSTLLAETMPASPTSPTRMATAGCYRNEAIAMCDLLWKFGDVDHVRRS